MGSLSGIGSMGGDSVAGYRELSLYFHITAAGTTLDCIIQDSPDGSRYYNRATVAQISATGNVATRLADTIGEHFRVSYNAVGTWELEVTAIAKT